MSANYGSTADLSDEQLRALWVLVEAAESDSEIRDYLLREQIDGAASAIHRLRSLVHEVYPDYKFAYRIDTDDESWRYTWDT